MGAVERMNYDEKPEGDPVKLAAALQHTERYLAHTHAAQSLRRKIDWATRLFEWYDAGVQWYCVEGGGSIVRRYRAAAVVVDGVTYKHAAGILPGLSL